MSASHDHLAVEYEPSEDWMPAAPATRRRPEGAAERLARCGPPVLTDAEALALLVGCQADEAAGLIAAFGSLTEVLAQPRADLARHISPSAAARITLVHDLARRALEGPLRRRDVLSSWSAVQTYLKAALAGVPREQFRVLFLDKRNQIIADEVLGTGTVDHAPVYPREIVRRALELNASALVLAHNHPSGDPTPSSADIQMTREVVDATRALRIAVHDHIIVGGASVASFKSLGLM
ncbi:DNA repair protein RadC [Phenylobacterium sp.]|uniref:RadC family protein n=1 Tax=Phenylobacterium sp. TaxID=1871053 RepID=UPI003563C3AF